MIARVAGRAGPREVKGERLDGDPHRNSLRLLPSGPDRVGEGYVHRQPLEGHYIRCSRARSKAQDGWQKPPVNTQRWLAFLSLPGAVGAVKKPTKSTPDRVIDLIYYG